MAFLNPALLKGPFSYSKATEQMNFLKSLPERKARTARCYELPFAKVCKNYANTHTPPTFHHIDKY